MRRPFYMDSMKAQEFGVIDKDLTGSLLKHLYEFLIKLSPNDFFQQDGYGGLISTWSNQWLVAKINKAAIIDLFNLLFEELHKQFEQLLSGISSLPSVVVSNVNGCLSSDAKFSPDDFLVLLRCSIIIMQFPEIGVSLVLERCQILFAILRKLCPPLSQPQFPNLCARHVDVINPEAGISANFAFAILEVFLNELLMNHELRKHFIEADCAFAMKGKLFLPHGQEGNLDAFWPLLCDIKGPTFPHTSLAKILKDSVHKSSSITIASNIKKVRAQIKYRHYEDHRRSGIGESTEMETSDEKSNVTNMLQTNGTENHDTVTEANTCTGEIFLKCLPGYHDNHSNWEDLVDFIECKQGKDYSTWLEKRARFRKWKYKRISSIKHEAKKRKRMWGSLSCRRF